MEQLSIFDILILCIKKTYKEYSNYNSVLEPYKAHTLSFIDLMNNLSIKYKNCLERIIEAYKGGV